MRHVDYNDKPDHPGTETHRSVDEAITEETPNRYREGFAAASGVRNETAETGGRIDHPESQDAAHPDPVPAKLEEENAGLADS